MLSGNISGSFDGISAMLRDVAKPDLRPLAERIKAIVVEDNRAGLLAGIDADGQPMAPIKPATARRRGGSGPPGVPHDASSPLIARFDADVTASGEGLSVRAGWDGVPEAVYLDQGTANMPARKIAGIRPSTEARIGEALDEFAKGLLDADKITM